MQDDDWMLPRHFHTAQSDGSAPSSAAPRITIDPELVQARKLRKGKLSPQPGYVEDLVSAFDRSIARTVPGFQDRMWTLGDTARWVIERTQEAVDGWSIDETKLPEILLEIQDALARGEVSVFANTRNDPVPRELPAETWSVYDLVVEDRDDLIRIFPASSGANYEQELLNVRLRRDQILERWPAPSAGPRSVPKTTAGAANQCRRWLADMMRKALNEPRPKAAVAREAKEKFPGLGKRGFDRAWDAAVRETNAVKWRAPGRRS
jgi:hypothetical protein